MDEFVKLDLDDQEALTFHEEASEDEEATLTEVQALGPGCEEEAR